MTPPPQRMHHFTGEIPQNSPSNICIKSDSPTKKKHLAIFHYRVVKGGGVPRGGGPLMFPKVPQSSLGILRVPQLPPPLEHPTLKNPTIKLQGCTCYKDSREGGMSWVIYLHEWLKFNGFHVGKYTVRPMDPMAWDIPKPIPWIHMGMGSTFLVEKFSTHIGDGDKLNSTHPTFTGILITGTPLKFNPLILTIDTKHWY